jgi:DNA-binding XRE family transcriptional regulator
VRFVVSGNVPDFIMELFRSVFPTGKEENDEKMNIRDWGWFKEMEAKITSGISLRALRTMRKMKQKELAYMVGIKPQQISEMEKDRAPIGKKMAMRLGKALDMDYRHFL